MGAAASAPLAGRGHLFPRVLSPRLVHFFDGERPTVCGQVVGNKVLEVKASLVRVRPEGWLGFPLDVPETRIRHIPRLLYHWRQHEGSTAYSPAAKGDAPFAARRAIKEHLTQRGIDADVLPALEAPQYHRVKYALPTVPPAVTMVIPTRNHVDLVKPCVDSILSRTTYANFDILIVDNGSDDRDTIDYLHTLERTGAATILRDDRPFNFSAQMNNAVKHVRGEMTTISK